ESVLGAMLLSPRAVMAAVDRGLQPEHFYRRSHGTIYRAILALDEKGEKADSITVSRILQERGELEEIGGWAVVSTLASAAPTAANAAHYAQIVVDVAAERNLALAATKLAELASGPGS